jgi:hypothetical protein
MDRNEVGSDGPVKRLPEGVANHEVAAAVGWQLPVWAEPKLAKQALYNGDQWLRLFDAIVRAITKLEHTEALDFATLRFELWYRKKKARKEKPMMVQATIYQHPDYDRPWLYVERQEKNNGKQAV